ncbi:MAG: hypothetical protein LUD19_03580 [Clostridia bacterium]|nr:hypothetical protein [Clostridia bacterium]
MIDTENVLLQAIAEHGAEAQTRQCMEECAELIAALNKYLRVTAGGQDAYKHDGERMNVEEAKNGVLEEMADVQIMLDQMRLIYGSDDAQKEQKLLRLANRLGIAEDTAAGGLMSAT